LSIQHLYVSTACRHGACGSCRNTCKYCDEPCRHECHPQKAATDGQPQTWVDQARDIAAELLYLVRQADWLPDKLADRIRNDPSLFWLRGETQPDGTWR